MAVIETRYGRIPVALPPEASAGMNRTERLWVPELKQLIMKTCTQLSISGAVDMANAFLGRRGNDCFITRTIEDTVRQEGEKIGTAYQVMQRETLARYGFDPDTGKQVDSSLLPDEMKLATFSQACVDEMHQKIKDACEALNAQADQDDRRLTYTDVINQIETIPSEAVIVCIDEVGVCHQKEHRSVNETITTDDHKFVETTVSYIRTKEGTYRLSDDSIKGTLKLTLAFLLNKQYLANRQLLFFTDGAQNLRKGIEAVFGFREYTLNLDWYHLEKHCYEMFTQALRGGKDNLSRNYWIREEFFRYLWIGEVQKAKDYLDRIDPSAVKNQKQLEAIKAYLDRKSPYVYCFALRKQLGLINSSNQGEKSNDLVVASRQKHNGMSWCDSGSANMGNITLIIVNQEDTSWYSERTLPFTMVSPSKEISQIGA